MALRGMYFPFKRIVPLMQFTTESIITLFFPTALTQRWITLGTCFQLYRRPILWIMNDSRLGMCTAEQKVMVHCKFQGESRVLLTSNAHPCLSESNLIVNDSQLCIFTAAENRLTRSSSDMVALRAPSGLPKGKQNLKFVSWCSRRIRSLSLIWVNVSFSSWVTVPTPSGLDKQENGFKPVSNQHW